MFKFISELVGVEKEELPWPLMQIVDHRIFSENSIPQTWILAHHNGRLYHGIKEGALSDHEIIHTNLSLWRDPETCLPPPELDPANLYPKVLARYTQFSPDKGMQGKDMYKKQCIILKPDYRFLRQALNTNFVAQTTARKIYACQILDAQPHTSICKYHSVETSSVLRFHYRNKTIKLSLDGKRMVSLVFERYEYNLWEAINRGFPVNVRSCLESVAAGIKHMHSLRLVHGDTKPQNIFIKMSDSASGALPTRYVIGDFDSTQWRCSVIAGKYGTPLWSRNKKTGVDFVEEDDDWNGFDQLRMWLVGAMVGSRQELEDFEGTGMELGEAENGGGEG
ncbi:hypothetical protein G6011_01030 [Alternaria panax]|uniref:Protein kinase domain-containing protein n=1 Tax=Alternaria panax TaxID=48097 RepID=A0AAD4NVK7_9PLEO|nr:hypothetical protein G6011_01030 [Alternaria panax]